MIKLKKVLPVFLVSTVCVLGVFVVRASASFNSSNLISDGEFTNTSSMDTGAIQRFLERKGSFLQSISEGGRSAAQIIFDAAHGKNDATGSINGITVDESTGTVNPAVILVTLQKEQSLISMTSRSDSALQHAMGYACPDSGGCNPSFATFTKQVENGAWQLRYNYERSQGHGFSDYQVGQSFNFDGDTGTFSNKATASLYRYTPHVYNGNYNFWNLFYNVYELNLGEYAHVFVTETNPSVTLARGQSANFTLTVRNTGSATWYQNQVNLGTARNKDRVSVFTREGNGPSGWLGPQRVYMQQASVASGENATFSFYMRNDGVSPNTYREYFQLVADGITWMEDYGIYFEINVPQPLPDYAHRFITETNPSSTLSTGQAVNLTLTVKNTGAATWYQNRVNLGTARNKDRVSVFTREGSGPSGWLGPQRVFMQQAAVAPGDNATFSFFMRNDGVSPNTYREYFQLVADGITWMEDYGIYWEINVPQPAPAYAHTFITETNPSVTLARGQSANFTLTVKNTGSTTWQKNQVNLGTSRSKDRVSVFTREGSGPSGWLGPQRIYLQQDTVAPGAYGTFSFWMRNDGVSPNTYREYFQLVADGITWMEDYGIYWEINAT